ncbi:MAG: M20/M25/M40 family metallo-hydrolase [Pyrinomonadaceae bacterium]|nr:M20/M25/M40 family metallo-hydrolase [Pyrinomonadaceae bacterium]
MRKNLFVLFILLSFILPSAAFANDPSVTITKAEREMAENITAKQLSDYLHFIASDAMGGRNTPSQGLDITAEFLAFNLRKWGFKPAGDNGTFFQKMMIVGGKVDTSGLKMSVGGDALTSGDDFLHISGSGSGSGGLVFGGNGWMVKSKGIDALKGVDVAGKVVVLHNSGFNFRRFGPPKGIDRSDLTGEKGTDWADPMTYLKSKEAKGIILVASQQMQSQWSRVKRFLSGGRSRVKGMSDSDSGESLPILLINQSTGTKLFNGETSDINSASAFAMNKQVEFSAIKKQTETPTQNVVAIWEGSDPKLKEEMVAIGAHYDHVGGSCRGVSKTDKICNGADDDGSGTTAVLAIAEALAKTQKRPKRSILFVWHAGEEKGLWGAQYFNKYPTVNIKNVVAQLNIDMIGRSKKSGDTNPRNKDLSGPNEVYVIGSEMMSSKLGEITKGTNESYMNMKYNYKYDDPKDTNRFFFRSDHFMYAQNGIPIAFWFTGVHEDYHGAGDHADKIDYQKMEKIARTIFLTTWKLAELKERPAVDKKLPPELTRR